MAEFKSELFKSFDHDKYLLAVNHDQANETSIIWPTILPAAEAGQFFKSIIGDKLQDWQGMVLLNSGQVNNVPDELTVNAQGEAVSIARFTLEIGTDTDTDTEQLSEDDELCHEADMPGPDDRLGEGTATEILRVVAALPQRINVFGLFNGRRDLRWRTAQIHHTSFAVPAISYTDCVPSRDKIENLVANTAIGGLAVYAAALDEFAADCPILLRD